MNNFSSKLPISFFLIVVEDTKTRGIAIKMGNTILGHKPSEQLVLNLINLATKQALESRDWSGNPPIKDAWRGLLKRLKL